jgi:hypothetical protein
LLELTAPAGYGDAPTRIQFHSDIGPVHTVYGANATAHSIALQHASMIADDLGSSSATASNVADCSVGGQAAALFGYGNGSQVGYRVYIVHKDLLFEIRCSAQGELSSQALMDDLSMIGSVTWL